VRRFETHNIDEGSRQHVDVEVRYDGTNP